MIAFRLWGYLIRLLETHLKQHPDQPLPFVYPMVVYTGSDPWTAPLDIFPLFGDHQPLAQEWFLKPFQLLNIHETNDNEIRRRQWCGIVEFALKYKKVRDFKKFLDILLPWLLEIERNEPGCSLIRIVIKYVLDDLEGSDLTAFRQAVEKHLSPTLRGEVMTLAQQLIQVGEKKGITRGITQGISLGKTELMIRQLKRRFKRIPKNYLVRLEQADAETLSTWGERIIDAKTLKEVFEIA